MIKFGKKQKKTFAPGFSAFFLEGGAEKSFCLVFVRLNYPRCTLDLNLYPKHSHRPLKIEQEDGFSSSLVAIILGNTLSVLGAILKG
jgi:hypothetical protein